MSVSCVMNLAGCELVAAPAIELFRQYYSTLRAGFVSLFCCFVQEGVFYAVML